MNRTLRLPAEMFAKLDQLAERDKRSTNAQIAHVLTLYVKRQERAEREN